MIRGAIITMVIILVLIGAQAHSIAKSLPPIFMVIGLRLVVIRVARAIVGQVTVLRCGPSSGVGPAGHVVMVAAVGGLARILSAGFGTPMEQFLMVG